MSKLCIEVFCSLNDAIARGIGMTPRSASDKEYFAQDWFLEQIQNIADVTVLLQGRNSYPDFWVDGFGIRHGYEVKSLAFSKGRPEVQLKSV